MMKKFILICSLITTLAQGTNTNNVVDLGVFNSASAIMLDHGNREDFVSFDIRIYVDGNLTNEVLLGTKTNVLGYSDLPGTLKDGRHIIAITTQFAGVLRSEISLYSLTLRREKPIKPIARLVRTIDPSVITNEPTEVKIKRLLQITPKDVPTPPPLPTDTNAMTPIEAAMKRVYNRERRK